VAFATGTACHFVVSELRTIPAPGRAVGKLLLTRRNNRLHRSDNEPQG
jgi:hypothetical protein